VRTEEDFHGDDEHLFLETLSVDVTNAGEPGLTMPAEHERCRENPRPVTRYRRLLSHVSDSKLMCFSAGDRFGPFKEHKEHGCDQGIASDIVPVLSRSGGAEYNVP
jgi:hypothetical protein